MYDWALCPILDQWELLHLTIIWSLHSVGACLEKCLHVSFTLTELG